MKIPLHSQHTHTHFNLHTYLEKIHSCLRLIIKRVVCQNEIQINHVHLLLLLLLLLGTSSWRCLILTLGDEGSKEETEAFLKDVGFCGWMGGIFLAFSPQPGSRHSRQPTLSYQDGLVLEHSQLESHRWKALGAVNQTQMSVNLVKRVDGLDFA